MWRFPLFFMAVAESEALGYRGRLPRLAFLFAVVWRVFLCTLVFAGVHAAAMLAGKVASEWILLLIILLCFAAVAPKAIQRFHDFGAPAWAALAVLFFPLLPLTLFFVNWTDSNAPSFLLVLWWMLVVPVWAIAFAGATLLIPSSKSNRYGPNPNA